MRSMPGNTLMTALVVLFIAACAKDAPPAPAPAPSVEKAPAAAAAEAQPAASAEAKPAGGIETHTNVAKPESAGAGADAETKAKLAGVYKEIYCAQRRGESEKLLEIYTKHGFDDPETWTKSWTKAAQDGAWVAKTTHDAIRACSDAAPAAAKTPPTTP